MTEEEKRAELKKATEDLQKATGEPKGNEPEVVGLLAKAVSALAGLVGLNKSAAPVEEKGEEAVEEKPPEENPEGEGDPEEEGEEMGKSQSFTEEQLLKSLSESGSFVEAVEASEALEHMTNVFTKSLTELYTENVTLRKSLAAVEAQNKRMAELTTGLSHGVIALLKSQETLHKSMEEVMSQPVGTTSPGVRIMQQAAGTTVLTKSMLTSSLKKAVEAGDLQSNFLAMVDTNTTEELLGKLPVSFKNQYLNIQKEAQL